MSDREKREKKREEEGGGRERIEEGIVKIHILSTFICTLLGAELEFSRF
jgi:hypothetical protein